MDAVEKMAAYEELIFQAHKMLDEAQVPTATGAPCDDPKCQSKLIHRLHVLLADHKSATEDAWKYRDLCKQKLLT